MGSEKLSVLAIGFISADLCYFTCRMGLTIKVTRIIVRVSGGDAWHIGPGSVEGSGRESCSPIFVAVDIGEEVLRSLSQVCFFSPAPVPFLEGFSEGCMCTGPLGGPGLFPREGSCLSGEVASACDKLS